MNNKKSKSFKDLIVWQKSHQLVLSVYKISEVFPRKEIFGLTSQLRRSIVSVPANIAEGFKKRGKADKLRFLNIAQGSLEESRYYLLLSKDLNYGDSSQLLPLVEEVSKLIEAYYKAILNSEF
jgi:four helix bundle protein